VRAAGASSAAAVTTAGYLLFSGPLDQPDDEHCRPTGFDCEESARLAFVRIRLQPSSESLWAELVAVHPDEKPRTLCWFGMPTNRADHLVRVATACDVNRLGSLSHRHLRMGIITRLRKGGGTVGEPPSATGLGTPPSEADAEEDRDGSPDPATTCTQSAYSRNQTGADRPGSSLVAADEHAGASSWLRRLGVSVALEAVRDRRVPEPPGSAILGSHSGPVILSRRRKTVAP